MAASTELELSIVFCTSAMVFCVVGLVLFSRAEKQLNKAAEIRKRAREELNDARLLWGTMRANANVTRRVTVESTLPASPAQEEKPSLN